MGRECKEGGGVSDYMACGNVLVTAVKITLLQYVLWLWDQPHSQDSQQSLGGHLGTV